MVELFQARATAGMVCCLGCFQNLEHWSLREEDATRLCFIGCQKFDDTRACGQMYEWRGFPYRDFTHANA